MHGKTRPSSILTKIGPALSQEERQPLDCCSPAHHGIRTYLALTFVNTSLRYRPLVSTFAKRSYASSSSRAFFSVQLVLRITVFNARQLQSGKPTLRLARIAAAVPDANWMLTLFKSSRIDSLFGERCGAVNMAELR
jgi:hypothetical protein